MLHPMSVSGLALSAFLAAAAPVAAADHVNANGLPTDHSTPAEQAQTSDLNQQIQRANQASDAQAAGSSAQYEQQKQQYENQMQQHQAVQQQYEDQKAVYDSQTAAYEDLRTRYAAERRAYHRGVWPSRYASWRLERDARLIGQRVEIISGDHVGTVTEVARYRDGRVEALRVALDSDKVVWIDAEDVRYDRTDGIVMTNLNRADLHAMADERL